MSDQINPYLAARITDLLERSDLYSREEFFKITHLPPFDIKENESAYCLKCDVPGIDAQDITVDIEGRTLSISALAEAEAEEKGRYLLKERRSEKFNLQYTFPTDIDIDNVTADLANGVLTLSLPKVKTSERKTIEIARNDEK